MRKLSCNLRWYKYFFLKERKLAFMPSYQLEKKIKRELRMQEECLTKYLSVVLIPLLILH